MRGHGPRQEGLITMRNRVEKRGKRRRGGRSRQKKVPKGERRWWRYNKDDRKERDGKPAQSVADLCISL